MFAALSWFACLGARADALTLRWRAPPACPPAAVVQRTIEARLAQPSGNASHVVRVTGHVREQGGQFELSVSIARTSDAVQRDLSAATCGELVDALAWLVSLGESRGQTATRTQTSSTNSRPAARRAPSGVRSTSAEGSTIEPVRGTATIVPQEEAEALSRAPSDSVMPASLDAKVAGDEQRSAAASENPQAGSVLEQEPVSLPAKRSALAKDVPDRAQTPARSARLQRWGRASLFSGAWNDHLARTRALLGGGAGIGFGWLYLELRYEHDFSRTLAFSGAGRVTVGSDALTLAGCSLWSLAGGLVRLGPCLQAVGMRTSAATHGTSQPAHGHDTWFLGAAALQGGYRFWSMLELVGELGLAVPLGSRPSFSVEGVGQVARAEKLAERASLAIAARW